MEMALPANRPRGKDDEARARVLRGFHVGDRVFRLMTQASAITVLVILAGVLISLVYGSLPAWRAFGFDFLTTQIWNPVTEKFGALPAIYGTIITSAIAMLIGVPVSIGIAIALNASGARLALPLNCSRGFRASYMVFGVYSFSRHSSKRTYNPRSLPHLQTFHC
jgi:ABC-type phosphate transport system permease subunit